MPDLDSYGRFAESDDRMVFGFQRENNASSAPERRFHIPASGMDYTEPHKLGRTLLPALQRTSAYESLTWSNTEQRSSKMYDKKPLSLENEGDEAATQGNSILRPVSPIVNTSGGQNDQTASFLVQGQHSSSNMNKDKTIHIHHQTGKGQGKQSHVNHPNPSNSSKPVKTEFIGNSGEDEPLANLLAESVGCYYWELGSSEGTQEP